MCFFVVNGRSWCPFCCSAASRPALDRTSQCKGRFLLAAGGHAKTDTSRCFWMVALLPVFFAKHEQMFLLSLCLQYHVHIVYIHGLVMFGLFLGGSTWFRLCLSQPMRHSDTMAGCVQRPRHCPSRSRALLQCRIACQVSYWKDVMYRELQLRRSKIPSLRRCLTFFDHLNHDIYIYIISLIVVLNDVNIGELWSITRISYGLQAWYFIAANVIMINHCWALGMGCYYTIIIKAVVINHI
jgi:hypothetical protein